MQTQTDTTVASTETLVSEFISVVNRALDRHGDSFPVKHLLQLIEKMISGKQRIGLAVYSSDADSPHDYFTAVFNPAQRLEIISRGKHMPDVEWKLPMPYMREVTTHAEAYVENPAKLDWAWLKARFS